MLHEEVSMNLTELANLHLPKQYEYTGWKGSLNSASSPSRGFDRTTPRGHAFGPSRTRLIKSCLLSRTQDLDPCNLAKTDKICEVEAAESSRMLVPNFDDCRRV